MTEAIHRPVHNDMDCHGAARLAMTAGASLRPRLVIARNEAIHRPVHNDMDCHGAARLAMTQVRRASQ